jgi:hypothetical protein
VRGNAFYTLTEEQLIALKTAASEFPLVSVRPAQAVAPNLAPNLMQLPYGYQQQAFEPQGMHSGLPFGFPMGFHSNMQPGFAPQAFPSNFQRPSTVQVSEIDEQPHITSLMKLNPKLFNALVAAYPNKHIPLLSVAQLKTLVNKYGKECDKPAPPTTRSRRAADEPKKKGAKRPAEESAEDDEELEAEDASSSPKASKEKTKVDKPKKAPKADKTDKSKRKKAKQSDAAEEQ